MKKKLCILAVIITVIGIIVVAVAGFNVNLEYRAHQSISVPIGTEFNIADIKSMTDEVFGKEEVQIKKSSIYKDTAIINVKTSTQEQLDQIKNKVNEKYNLKSENKEETSEEATQNSDNNVTDEVSENTTNTEATSTENTEDTASSAKSETIELTVTEVPRVTLFDMAKQYILYVGISAVIVLVYFAVRFKKMNIPKVLLRSIVLLVVAELLYMAIIAITRYPIDKIAIIGAIVVYILVLTYLNNSFIKAKENGTENTTKK